MDVVAHVFEVPTDKRSRHENSELEMFVHIVKALGRIRPKVWRDY
ncbi:hypothetical protein ACIRRA_15145 [Nocardia sp. NPDC101769]